MSRVHLLKSMVMSVAVVSFLVCPAFGQSTFTLEWFTSTHTLIPNNSTINAVAGTPLTLNLYIHETGGNLLQGADPLFSFGMRTTYGTSGVLSVATINSPDMASNPLFDTISARETTAAYAQFASAANNTFPGNTSDANGRIWLGSFRYQTTLGSTTLTAGDIPVLGQEDWILGNTFTVIDPLIVNSQINVNVNPVPEPSTVLLIGVGCLGFGRLIVRRRKTTAAPVLAT